MPKIFVTGGSGFIGSHIIPQLLSRSYSVVALARSDESAQKILAHASSIEIVKGDLSDTEILKTTASRPDIDGIIHAGFIHDFADLANSNKVDLVAVKVFGEAFKGTNKTLITTTGFLRDNLNGQILTEKDSAPAAPFAIHGDESDEYIVNLAKEGVRSVVIRLAPSVHGPNDKGFIPFAIHLAKQNNLSAYVYRSKGSDNPNESVRWPTIHVKDAAKLYLSALESAPAGSVLHGVAETVLFSDIAKVIGKKLGVEVKGVEKEDAAEHFDWMAMFAGHDQPVSSDVTKELTGWESKEVGLVEDLEQGDYFNKYQ